MSKQTQIHRLAAEREFQALSDIGVELHNLNRDTRRLRPSMEMVDPDESFEERHRKRLQKWAKSHEDLLDVVERNKLFLSAALYDSFIQILELARNEAIELNVDVEDENVMRKERLPIQSYKRAQENIAALSDALQKAVLMIRQRYGMKD